MVLERVQQLVTQAEKMLWAQSRRGQGGDGRAEREAGNLLEEARRLLAAERERRAAAGQADCCH